MTLANQTGLFSLLLLDILLLAYSVMSDTIVDNPVHFPGNDYRSPSMGIIVAIAIPLEVKGPVDAFFTTYFEASYALPKNDTRLTFPPIIGTVTRAFVYNLLETKINNYGYPGKPCLLRAICEAAEYTTKNHGVLGDLLHVLLTPSTSSNEDFLFDYAGSEEYGRTRGHCKKYRKKCTLSILDLISIVKNKFHIYEIISFLLENLPARTVKKKLYQLTPAKTIWCSL